MSVVNVHEAKTHLSRLLEEVEAGEEVIIARNGKAIARLLPIALEPRRPGRLKGKLRLRKDFDAPLPAAIARRFRGEAS